MSRRFADLHILLNHSDNKDNLSEIVRSAEMLDLSSIVIFDTIEKTSEIKKFNDLREKIAKINTDTNIYIGAQISSNNPETVKSLILKTRSKVDIVAVSGGDIIINRLAVESSKVDILLSPEFSRKDSGLDEVMAKLAAKNNVAIGFSFRPVLHTYSKIRAHILSHMIYNWKLVKRFDTPFVIISSAQDVWDMRTGRELASFGTIIGMELSTALDAVSTNCEKIIGKIKK